MVGLWFCNNPGSLHRLGRNGCCRGKKALWPEAFMFYATGVQHTHESILCFPSGEAQLPTQAPASLNKCMALTPSFLPFP